MKAVKTKDQKVAKDNRDGMTWGRAGSLVSLQTLPSFPGTSPR